MFRGGWSMSKEEKLLREIKETLERVQTVLGPIGPTHLTSLDGWTWRLESVSARTILNRGAGRVPVIQQITNERGWINSLIIIFNDPDSVLHFNCDNWNFSVSPRTINTVFGAVGPNNAYLYICVYNPATIMGPLYGLAWTPSQFWPYNSQIGFFVEHPATALTATSQVVVAALGRHYIRNEKQFYESIFIESGKQIVGSTSVPLERRPYHG